MLWVLESNSSSVVEREAYTFVVAGSIPACWTLVRINCGRSACTLKLDLRGHWFEPSLWGLWFLTDTIPYTPFAGLR